MGRVSYIPSRCAMPVVCGIDFDIRETIESAMGNVVNDFIVKPFQSWCLGIWHWIVSVSLPVCVVVTLMALMLYMIGAKKSRKWIILPAIIYLFIQIANSML